ncbi:MAG: glycosyltransferase [Calditrichaeota bacterium]|nr:MAG: glycosyltransferase [Calditrichota bacterium]
MKKVLFLTSNFPPSRSVGTQRVTKILKYMDPARYQFHILTLDEAFYGNQWDDSHVLEKRVPPATGVTRQPFKDLTSVFTWMKAKVTPKKSTVSAASPKASGKQGNGSGAARNTRPGLLTRWINGLRDAIFGVLEFPDKYIGWYRSAVKEGTRLVRDNKIDIILTTAPPHSLFVMATRIKKQTGAKLVLDYRDPWALSRWDKGSRLKTFFEHYLEKKAITTADAVLFVTDKLKEAYAHHYAHLNPEKFHVFYNGYDADDFEGKQNQPSGNPLRFVHLGTLYKKRNPQKLFDAVKKLKDEGLLSADKVRFEFIGYVARELSFLYDYLESLDISDLVTFEDNITFDQSLQTMYAASVLVIVQPFTDLQVPAKLLEYMYTRRPILALCEPGSATAAMVEKGRLGYVAASQDVDAIANGIKELLRHLEQPQFEPDESYIRGFDMKTYIAQLDNIFGNL